MDDRLFEFNLRQSVGPGPGYVSADLFGAAACDQAGDGDDTAVPGGELVAFPNVREEHAVCENDEHPREPHVPRSRKRMSGGAILCNRPR